MFPHTLCQNCIIDEINPFNPKPATGKWFFHVNPCDQCTPRTLSSNHGLHCLLTASSYFEIFLGPHSGSHVDWVRFLQDSFSCESDCFDLDGSFNQYPFQMLTKVLKRIYLSYNLALLTASAYQRKQKQELSEGQRARLF
jgi:hypothetical protein